MLGQKCNCNTVVFRYEIDPHCMRSLDAHCQSSSPAQIVYGVHRLSECHNPAVIVLETDCDRSYIAGCPGTIPLNTAVPHWALLNYTVRARCLGRGTKPHLGLDRRPSRSCGRQDRGGSAGVHCDGSLDRFAVQYPYTSEFTTTNSPSNQPGRLQQDEESNTGAIAGGVMGGMVAFGVICVRIWMFSRRLAVARGDQG